MARKKFNANTKGEKRHSKSAPVSAFKPVYKGGIMLGDPIYFPRRKKKKGYQK
jgi:hypothetical protein